MTPSPIRWGILGTGKIAHKFAADLKHTTGEAVAVGSRTVQSAESFAREFNIPKAYSSYEALLADPDVQVVYVSSPHSEHQTHTLQALRAGKAVLCEKPLAPTAPQVSEMIEEARQRKLFLMEALWMYFLPTFRQAQAWIEDGQIGEVRMIRAEFGFPAPTDPTNRLFNPALAGGALLDIGIYPLTFALRLAGAPLAQVQSTMKRAATGVDAATALQLTFENDVFASLACTFESRMRNEAVVYGTKGHIHLPLFWQSTEAYLYHDQSQAAHFQDDRSTWGYNFEAEAVHECLRKGELESAQMTWQHSTELIGLMDGIRHEHGFIYPFEQPNKSLFFSGLKTILAL